VRHDHGPRVEGDVILPAHGRGQQQDTYAAHNHGVNRTLALKIKKGKEEGYK
jgi:hypothetical protein